MSESLKTADIGSLETLLAIENTCFDSEKLSPRQMRYLLTKAKAKTWLLSIDQKPAAYAMCLLPRTPRPARLYSLAVLPEFRGQGLAVKLLSDVAAQLRELGYDRWRLEVDVANTKAIALYRQFGFSPIAELPQYYENGHDGIQMEISLLNIQLSNN